jgi:hypothetical protein
MRVQYLSVALSGKSEKAVNHTELNINLAGNKRPVRRALTLAVLPTKGKLSADMASPGKYPKRDCHRSTKASAIFGSRTPADVDGFVAEFGGTHHGDDDEPGRRWHTHRANQRSMLPVRRIFPCNSMTP